MNNQENQQEQTPSLSSLMKKRKHNELVVIEYELNEIVNKKIQKLQKKEKILLPVSDPHEEVSIYKKKHYIILHNNLIYIYFLILTL